MKCHKCKIKVGNYVYNNSFRKMCKSCAPCTEQQCSYRIIYVVRGSNGALILDKTNISATCRCEFALARIAAGMCHKCTNQKAEFVRSNSNVKLCKYCADCNLLGCCYRIELCNLDPYTNTYLLNQALLNLSYSWCASECNMKNKPEIKFNPIGMPSKAADPVKTYATILQEILVQSRTYKPKIPSERSAFSPVNF